MEYTQTLSKQQSPESSVQQPTGQSSRGLLVIVTFSVLVTAVLIGLIVFFWQKSIYESEVNDLKLRINTLEKLVASTEKLELISQQTSTNLDWKKVNVQPNTKLGISFQPFDLYYPLDWSLTIINEPDYVLKLKLRKNESNITIQQVEEGRGDCYYSGDYDKAEYMANKYGEFSEINKNGTTWRVAPLIDKPTQFDVCELSTKNNKYVGFTKIGAIFMEDLSLESQSLDTLKLILDRIEVLE